MRISDWSSDVCSSDLCLSSGPASGGSGGGRINRTARGRARGPAVEPGEAQKRCDADRVRSARRGRPSGASDRRDHRVRHRSEEHTSELQSLMRISYTVFCLKKKIRQYTHNIADNTPLYRAK